MPTASLLNMLRNYLQIALRTLSRKKGLAAINTAGLAIGLACCLVLGLYIEHHLSFDRFHQEADRIYRVQMVNEEIEGGTAVNARSTPMLGPAIEAEFAAVEHAVRMLASTTSIVVDGQDHPVRVLYADPALFDVFTFDRAREIPSDVLDSPNALILTRSTAHRLFGDAAALGHAADVTIRDEGRPFLVAGVMDDVPETSSIHFDAVVPFEHAPLTWPEWTRQFAFETWSMPVSNLFVKLRPGADPRQLGEDLHALLNRHVEEHGHRPVGVELLPLHDVHLASDVHGGLAPTANTLYLQILGGIALLILLLACINFVTLTLGMSASRGREVGVRQTLGARRGQLATQFLGEAALLTVLALGLAVGLAAALLPTASVLLEAPLADAFTFQPAHLVYLALLGGAVALLSGAHPALVLSAQRPARAMKGGLDLKGHSAVMRPLVVTQFAISIALILVVMGMSLQLRFMMNHDLGLPDPDLLVLDLGGSTAGGLIYEPLRAELGARPQIAEVTGAYFSFGTAGMDIELISSTGQAVRAHMNPVDDNYVGALGLELVAGHSIAAGRSELGVVVNETLVRRLGWSDPIGRALPLGEGGSFGQMLQDAVVHGVVRDYHVRSLHDEIPPIILAPRSVVGDGVMAALIRFNSAERAAGLDAVRSAWERVVPGELLRYSYLGDAAAAAYQDEARWRTIMRFAAGIAVLIAALGLFGLATLAAERRRKEVGIRKVLGASVGHIVALLSKDFLKLVAIGFVVAAPAGYWAMSRWLESFAYRIDVGPELFVATGALALVITLLAVGYHALRAATADPVKAISSE